MKLTSKSRTIVVMAATYIVMMVVVAGLNSIMTKKSEDILKTSITAHLFAATKIARPHVDGDIHKQFADASSMQLPEYQEMRAQFKECAKLMNVVCIYTMSRDKSGNLYIIVDSDDTTVCGDKYEIFETSGDIFEKAFGGHEAVDVQNVVDAFGNSFSAAIPIYDSQNEIVAALGVDIDASPISEEYRIRFYTMAFLYVLITALFGFMILLVKNSVSKDFKVQEERYRMAVAATSDALFDYQITDDIVYVSSRFFAMIGRRTPETDGLTMTKYALFDMIGKDSAIIDESIQKLQFREAGTVSCEVNVPTEYSSIWLNICASPVYDPETGKLTRVAGSISEITEHKKSAAAISSLAYSDPLTKLPNRIFLFDRLRELSETDGSKFSLLFIDLDNFKSVNDTKGHDVGDELLRRVSKFLKESLPERPDVFRPEPGTMSFAARFGGDEFVLVNVGCSDEKSAEQFGNHLIKEFNTSSKCEYIRNLNVTLSVGVAVFPGHTSDIQHLIKCADKAMYLAKKSGKNQIKVYNA